MATALSNTEAYICFYLAGGEGKLASGRGDLVHKLATAENPKRRLVFHVALRFLFVRFM
jgi:hypothetical protein